MLMLGPLLQRLGRCRRGAAAIEFAIYGPIVIVLLLGVVELGRLFWLRASLQFAAEDSARLALASPGVSDAQLTAVVGHRLGNPLPAGVTVRVERDRVSGQDFVTVRIAGRFDAVAGLIPISGVPIEGRARVPLTP